MIRILNWIGNVLLALAVGLVLLGYIGVALLRGPVALLDLLSPFNIYNWIAVIAVLTPGALIKTLAKMMSLRSTAGSEPPRDQLEWHDEDLQAAADAIIAEYGNVLMKVS